MKLNPGKSKGSIFVVSGPSGSGKTTLAVKVLETKELKTRLIKSISLTTRLKRSEERDKKDYFFVTKEKFLKLLKAKKILEWTRFLGYYYATPKDFVEAQIKKCRHIILCLDLKGSQVMKRLYPENTVTIFVLPPSLSALKKRIQKRCQKTTSEEIRNRLKIARNELLAADKYDYCILNDNLKQGVNRLKRIILNKINP